MISTNSYAGRQRDVELLQSIVDPDGTQQVHISNIGRTPKMVAGIQKALQRYCVILLSQLGTVRFAPGEGTELLADLMNGIVADAGALRRSFNQANSLALRQLASDDANTVTFGEIPADEVLVGAQLDDFSINYQTSTVMLQILFTTAAGTNLTYVVPAATARQ